MERGLLASLSINEEITLRRVALGIAMTVDLPAADVLRLRNLGLVEDNAAHLRLTTIGQRRFDQLPKSRFGRPAKPIDQRIVAGGKALRTLDKETER